MTVSFVEREVRSILDQGKAARREDGYYDKTFREWIVTGQRADDLDHAVFDGLSEVESRKLNGPGVHLQVGFPREIRVGQEVGNLTAGGLWVSEPWRRELIEAAEDVSPMQRVSDGFTTNTGADVGLRAVDEAGVEGEIIAEGVAQTEIDITSARAIIIPTFLFGSGRVLTSWQLMADLGDLLPTYLASILGKRIGRRLNRALTAGQAGNEPRGIVFAASVGVTAAAAGAITTAELQRLPDALDSSIRYNPTSGFMMNSTTYGEVRRLTDGQGRPIWLPDPSGNNGPGLIDGRPVFLNSAMPAMAASNIPIVYGDFSLYLVRTVRQVMLVRLNELYALNGRTGWFSYARFGGDLLNVGTVPAAVAIQMAA